LEAHSVVSSFLVNVVAVQQFSKSVSHLPKTKV